MSSGESRSLLPTVNNSDRARETTKNRLCTFFRQTFLLCSPFLYLAILMLCVLALIIHPTIIAVTDHWFASSTSPSMHQKRSSLLQYSSSSAAADLVIDLPGFDTSSTYLSSLTQYSGYIDALDGRQLHYWYFESERVANGESISDIPLFFWTNGGPGCSGLLGLLSEQGPFWAIDEDGNLMENPYSWHKEVHIVFIEQPYGVGFSVVDDGMSAISGDAAAALDFDAGIRSFLTKFDELAENEVYLSAESFGGHYMPMTSLQILQNNDNGFTPNINFKGFMVGNPYTNTYENTFGMVEGWYGHGLMREDYYEVWRDDCWDNYHAIDTKYVCSKIYVSTYEDISDYIDLYALDYDDCSTSWSSSSNAKMSKLRRKTKKHEKQLFLHKIIANEIQAMLDTYESNDDWKAMLLPPATDDSHKTTKIDIHAQFAKRFPTRESIIDFQQSLKENEKSKNGNGRSLLSLSTDSSYYACASKYVADYLSMDTVQSALNIKDSANGWSMCNNKIFSAWPDSNWNNPMQQYYEQLVTDYSGQLKILIYSGDDDSVCGMRGTQFWLNRMKGWTKDSEVKWEAIEYNEQLAGYLTHYVDDTTQESLVYFLTVHSAGHMVPQTQPGRALALLQKYLYDLS